MTNIINNLYVGNDADYEDVKENKDWYILRCCKDGPGSHRELLGYTTMAAPKGENYLFAKRGRVLALNFIDSDDPNFIPEKMVNKGIEFITEQIDKGHKVLVACNAGHSRGPSTALLYMRSVNELPDGFRSGYRIFHTLYPKYEPAQGIEHYLKIHYNDFKKD